MKTRTPEEKAAAMLRSKERERIMQKRKEFLERKSERENARQLGVVYFVTDGSGFVKIGCTCNDVSARMSSMQTSNPRRLELLGTIETDDMLTLEAQLHGEFQTNRHDIGEWFLIGLDDVIECLAKHGGKLNIQGRNVAKSYCQTG
jgi:hypothetical protein